MRKHFLLIFIIVLSFSTIYSQTVSLNTLGVSPRDAVVDTTDIFDLAYSSLPNVGVGTKIYLKATSSDPLSGSQSWTFFKPFGSVAEIEAKVTDTNSETIAYTPDATGTFVIIFTDNGISDTITINSGTYLSMTKAPECGFCHNTEEYDFVVDKWSETGHATALTRGLNGMKGDHFGPSCVPYLSIESVRY